MTSSNIDAWRRVSAILDEALELDARERSAFLERACGGDAALRGEVEALLRSCDEAGAFLDVPIVQQAAELVSNAAAAHPGPPGEIKPGNRVGNYRIVREAGRGGMGTVYEAERADDHFRQRVALKVVRQGLDANSHFARRFVEERRILASLEHPGIARLIDGGVTDDEMSWFAMEFVEGAPIDRYCEARRLDIDARLTLFAAVCDVVQFAHRNLVVHRDLKPTNILVDGNGSVKLLDFGLAKLIGEDAAGAVVTPQGLRLLTPQYASPEQVAGARITPASDVYSLGAILYELLSGQRPYRLTGRSAKEIIQVLFEEQTKPPSAVAERMRPRLKGDLDAIVLTAMHRDPGRRYAGADGLAADIRRHLAALPVSARADTWRYRTGKFLRRNRLLVGAGAALLLALVVGIGGATWRARVASGEAATALHSLGTLLGERGDHAAADSVLRRALALRMSALDRSDWRIAETQRALGASLAGLGRYDEAERMLLESYHRYRASARSAQEAAESLRRLVAFYESRGRAADAARLRTAVPPSR